MPTHQIFDLNEWAKKLNVAQQSSAQIPQEGKCITGPADIWIVEYLRGKIGIQSKSSSCTPVDVFVLGLGEPNDPRCTKIGGVPFRDAFMPWPSIDSFQSTFLAQFNFSESRDIVGETPEDLLLVFVSGPDYRDFHFEWSSLDISERVTAKSMPKPEFRVLNAYGTRYRTNDFSIDPRQWRLGILDATKIGGIPDFNGLGVGWDEQKNTPERFIDDLDEVVQGRHICTLNSHVPNPYFEYPFVNKAEISPVESQNNRFSMVDMGALYIYMMDEGKVNYFFEYG